MNKQDLIKKINKIQGISREEKAYLVDLVNTKKKYGLVWENKPEDVEEQLRSMLPVFKEVKERAIISEDKTAPNHILIEGDNLHALTALTYTHEEKIDVIYIDPPYNTGNKDFIYNDHYVDKEDTYRHSKWLSFMEKRLKIAKHLLSEKGVIFISIDDNEVAQLKMLCDETFGPNNFLGNLIWQSRTSISNDDYISTNHNHTLIFSKNKTLVSFYGEKLNESEYVNPDGDKRGPWKLVPIDANKPGGNTVYGIINPKTGKEYFPPNKRIWAINRDSYEILFNQGRIKFGMNDDSSPKKKLYLAERLAKGDNKTPSSLLLSAGTTKDGTNEIINILGSKKFSYPKPSILIAKLLEYTTNFQNSYTILDFFAGSGTTLHATMALNAEDGGNRQCILVTNNENNIAEEVTYERNKRVIQGYTNAKGDQVEGLTNNNLRYYQSDFIPSARTEVNRRQLTARSTELLCIKENCYHCITADFGINPKQAQLFTDLLGRYMVVVYHSRSMEAVVEKLTEVIQGLETTEKVKIYAFSPEKDSIEDDFFAVQDKIETVPLPDSIYNAYVATFRNITLSQNQADASTQKQDN